MRFVTNDGLFNTEMRSVKDLIICMFIVEWVVTSMVEMGLKISLRFNDSPEFHLIIQLLPINHCLDAQCKQWFILDLVNKT